MMMKNFIPLLFIILLSCTEKGNQKEKMQTGKFEPTWESLKQYSVPEWFRDAKFGIWAHWGPQCQPEQGDWYARYMYAEGHHKYQSHLENYGHPSEFGFKDVINEWKAEKWDPEKLVALYKRAGAKYFFAMGNHHGATPPSEAYSLNFYNRTVDMINKYEPDLLYFDDTALPLWPASNIGLDIAAHYYNSNMKLHDGKLEAVLFGKILTEEQKECLVWDVERGAAEDIQEMPWQSCTCIGGWHYSRDVYEKGRYKSSKMVMQMLADIVSKNGNLLLNVPVRGDGSIDEKEVAVVEGITKWMDINSEAIYETRPWKIYGEGPKAESDNPMRAQGFNEGKGAPYTSEDIRFTKKGEVLYAIVMELPENDEEVLIKSLAKDSPYYRDSLNEVEMFGGEIISYQFDETGLRVKLPAQKDLIAPVVLKIY